MFRGRDKLIAAPGTGGTHQRASRRTGAPLRALASAGIGDPPQHLDRGMAAIDQQRESAGLDHSGGAGFDRIVRLSNGDRIGTGYRQEEGAIGG